MTHAPARRRHARFDTPVGELTATLAWDESGDGRATALTGLYFENHTYPPGSDLMGAPIAADTPGVLEQLRAELREYFDGRRTRFTVPLETHGDDFSERVWAILREIPHGTTTTYGTIAERLGSKGLAQRVGQAVGHNPISILIPCHRVVGADGSLTGFAGGIDRKRFLLELEEPDDAPVVRLF
ncbi:methylated-DNA--[protein]-cysteine S-methyltransferase [Aestuariimicrobium soli]|uniref:methylated-DNA--[protein]-cysteine S-methyltransferase n=1 Tax=Aestuariimicrobium soli TaxID=2035834 RepID=UPI003EBCA6E2